MPYTAPELHLGYGDLEVEEREDITNWNERTTEQTYVLD